MTTRVDGDPALTDIHARVRRVVAESGGLGGALATLGDEDDLWAAGMRSLSSVQVLLAVEEAFGVEFPDDLATRETFGRIRSIAEAVAALLAPTQDPA